MAMNITDKLKEATKDLLTEDTLKAIEESFDTAVNEKVQVHVDKALAEQDEDHAGKIKQLLEAIDSDHTVKLSKLVEVIDSNHLDKLKNIIAKYETVLNVEAKAFKNDMVDNVSNYLDLYLESLVPADEIHEAAHNKKSDAVLENLRKFFLSQELISRMMLNIKLDYVI